MRNEIRLGNPMKKISYFVIIALLLWGCSDTVENTEKPVKTTDASMQISFSLKGANDAITSVTGELQSSVHDNISFNFNISGETASYNIEHVQAGDWTLVVKAYNAQTELRHQGEEDISIVAGQVNSVSIVLDQTTGTAGFYVSWGSSGSVNLVIDLTNNPGSVNTYTYSLERDGFNSISESEAVAGLSIEAEVHDLKDGIWKLSIFAKNGAAVVAAGEGQIEVLNGLVTKVNASYNVVGPKVDISSQFDTQSGYADRVYVGDEAFRNFLIVKHHFTDLHSPYVLRSDAESVTQLEISTLDFSLFGSKAVDDHLNAQALTAFTNLEEIVLYGFTFKGLEFTNHPNLRTLGGIFITADYLDLSGAPNLKQLVLASLAIGWVDISNSTSLQILEIGDVDKQKGNGGFYYSYSFQCGLCRSVDGWITIVDGHLLSEIHY
ncbi:MAG: hypothetical protein KDD94_07085 [Calditrichaeota bacterium]|nr:hypothetical protein [Calditrichota bacterium]